MPEPGPTAAASTCQVVCGTDGARVSSKGSSILSGIDQRASSDNHGVKNPSPADRRVERATLEARSTGSTEAQPFSAFLCIVAILRASSSPRAREGVASGQWRKQTQIGNANHTTPIGKRRSARSRSWTWPCLRPHRETKPGSSKSRPPRRSRNPRVEARPRGRSVVRLIHGPWRMRRLD